jgi:hypothetical protein
MENAKVNKDGVPGKTPGLVNDVIEMAPPITLCPGPGQTTEKSAVGLFTRVSLPRNDDIIPGRHGNFQINTDVIKAS